MADSTDRRSGADRLRDEIRAGRGETFGDDELLASDREAVAALRRRAKAQDAEARREHQAAEKAAKADAAAKTERARARSKRRRTTGARARKATRKGRRVVRQAARTGPSGSFAGFVVWTLALVLFYVVLRRADRVGGFLGGIQSGIEWLADPNQIIEFGGNP